MESSLSDRRASVTWKELLFVVFFTANSVFWLTSIYKDVQQDVEQTDYVDKASRRRDNNLKNELEYKHQIMELNVDIKNLKQDLVEAKEDIEEWIVKYNELKEELAK